MLVGNSARGCIGSPITEQNHETNMVHFVAQRLHFWAIFYISRKKIKIRNLPLYVDPSFQRNLCTYLLDRTIDHWHFSKTARVMCNVEYGAQYGTFSTNVCGSHFL
jgi:hypothetical protein